MSSSSSNANPNLVPAVEPVVWRTTFEVNGRPVTIEDTVMDNEDIVVAVARDMILPRCRTPKKSSGARHRAGDFYRCRVCLNWSLGVAT